VVNNVERYANELEQKLVTARHQYSQLSIATNRMLRRILPSHVINDVWPSSVGEMATNREPQVSVESFEDIPLLGLHLRVRHNCRPSSDAVTADNEMTSLTGKFIDMVEKELADPVGIVRMEQSSNMAIIGAFSNEHLTRMASTGIRFANEVNE